MGKAQDSNTFGYYCSGGQTASPKCALGPVFVCDTRCRKGVYRKRRTFRPAAGRNRATLSHTGESYPAMLKITHLALYERRLQQNLEKYTGSPRKVPTARIG